MCRTRAHRGICPGGLGGWMVWWRLSATAMAGLWTRQWMDPAGAQPNAAGRLALWRPSWRDFLKEIFGWWKLISASAMLGLSRTSCRKSGADTLSFALVHLPGCDQAMPAAPAGARRMSVLAPTQQVLSVASFARSALYQPAPGAATHLQVLRSIHPSPFHTIVRYMRLHARLWDRGRVEQSACPCKRESSRSLMAHTSCFERYAGLGRGFGERPRAQGCRRPGKGLSTLTRCSSNVRRKVDLRKFTSSLPAACSSRRELPLWCGYPRARE